MRPVSTGGSLPRRATVLPPPPSNPDVLQACWDPSWCDVLSDDDFESMPPSSIPTCWQGPVTECHELQVDDIHYRTIASALGL